MNRLVYLLALIGLVAYSDAALGLNNGRYTIAASLSGLTMDVAARSIGLYNGRAFCPIPGGGDVSATTGGLVAQALRDQNIPLAQYLR